MNMITVLYSLLITVFIGTAWGCVYFFLKWRKGFNSDLVVMIDEENRHQIVPLKGNEFTYDEGKYFKEQGTGTVSHKGKTLHIFSKNNPIPMKLRHKKSEWLDAKSLKVTLENKLLKQIVTPQEKIDEILMKLGSIGGIIAGLSTTILLLKELGILNI